MYWCVRLRRQGLVPVVVYGNKVEPVNLQVTSRNLETALHHGAFSQLVSVDVAGGGSHNVLVREIAQAGVSPCGSLWQQSRAS